MESTHTALAGPLLLTPGRHRDSRGSFSETYNKRELESLGITDDFVQDNHVVSIESGTVRGLHLQVPPHPVAKLVRAVRGAIIDVAVDVRAGSPTFGEHVAVQISAYNRRQLYIPVGFAHGYCTLEPDTEVVYKVSDYWYPEAERGILWNDPALGIDWPVRPEEALVSERDQHLPPLVDIDPPFPDPAGA